MSALSDYIVTAAAKRRACDECGDDTAELRVYPFHGWIPDQNLCRPCLTDSDGNASWTDFLKVQEAAK